MRPGDAYWGHFAAKRPKISTNGSTRSESSAPTGLSTSFTSAASSWRAPPSRPRALQPTKRNLEGVPVGLKRWDFASKFAELIRQVSAHCRGARIPRSRDSAREFYHRLAIRHLQRRDNIIVAGCHIGAE